MTRIKITPTKLKGTVAIPPSKSMAHRAILCASLAKGKSRIDHIEYSQDILATIAAMQALGTTIETFEDYLLIDGSTTFTKKQSLIDCKESGSTLRFMIPVSLVKQGSRHFIGEGNLGKRPLDVFYPIFDEQHIDYSYQKDILDLHIEGKLQPGTFVIPGNISSQFITGLLYALPLLDGDSKIILSSSLESVGYIDLTLQMLEKYGIRIENHQHQEYLIAGNQTYQAQDYYVEADYSQAAFYLVAGALGNDVTLKGLNIHSLQGDKEGLDILKQMGATIDHQGDLLKVKVDKLHPTTIDGSQCPDIIPVFSLLASLIQGQSEVVNAGRLRIKECDRLKAMYNELTKLGVKVIEHNDGLTINGVTCLSGGELSTYNDHRIAMTLAIASSVSSQEIILDNKECVKKSYPCFWEDFEKLGGKIDEC